MGTAEIILLAAGIYAVFGAALGVFLVSSASGLPRLDPATTRAPFLFRLLILPGLILLWPLMLRKWISAPRVAAQTGAPTS